MLVLSRKKSEKILIGDDIVITVVRVDGREVRIGIDAPQGTRVLRGDLLPFTEPREKPRRGRGRRAA